MLIHILLTIIFIQHSSNDSDYYNANFLIPILVSNRTSISSIQLTSIGAFGLTRKARPDVPEHLHTGIDIKRPSENYLDEPIFPIAPGKAISIREDGPFAQIIIEHDVGNRDRFWTVYEHVSGIQVSVGDCVSPMKPTACFMSRGELDQFGWQFDHFHFEIIKVPPRPLKPTAETPNRLFGVYNLECYTPSDLHKYYFDPMEFLEKHLHK